MLKWAVPNQRRSVVLESGSLSVGENNLETCSNLSSDSSEGSYDLSVPIRYHERRASRPRSLALLLEGGDSERLDSVVTRKPSTHRTASSPLYSSCSRANRHSMIIVPPHDGNDVRYKSHTIDSMHAYRQTPSKLSVYQPTDNKASSNSDSENESGILKISTTGGEKTKSSRNSFWKSLRLKAQGKNKESKLAKAHSMSNLPVSKKLSSTTEVYADSPSSHLPNQTLPVTTSTSAHDISPSYRSKSNILRRRSFKLIKKENENKKPKPFTKPVEYSEELISSSPDSGVSSMRLNSNDSDNPSSPASPITPIDLEPTDLSGLKQQFTDAVLQYLNERLEKKGYNSTISVTSSSRSSRSEDGSSDVFCYDTDTVLRRPHHNNNNNSPAIKATY